MIRIVLLVALPQEYGALKKAIGPWRLVERKPFRKYLWVAPDRKVFLIETGMGGERVAHALAQVGASARPDLLVSAGFAGSLHEKLEVGQVYLGENFLLHNVSGSDAGNSAFFLQPAQDLSRFCTNILLQKAQLVTFNRPEPKQRLHRLYARVPTLMDMESYFVAEFAWQAKIPFLGIRAVSDGVTDAIDFDLTAISCSDGSISIRKVLTELVRRPRLLRSFHGCWRRSVVAAGNLAMVLKALFSLPGSALHSMVQHSRFDRRESSAVDEL